MYAFCFVKEEVLAPPPENDDVVNDFDIEEEVIEVENRLDIFHVSVDVQRQDKREGVWEYIRVRVRNNVDQCL